MKKSIFLLNTENNSNLTNSIEAILKKLSSYSKINFIFTSSCEDAVRQAKGHVLYIICGNSNNPKNCFSKEIINHISTNQKGIIIKIAQYCEDTTYCPKTRVIGISQDIIINGHKNDRIIDLFSFILEPPVFYISYGRLEDKPDDLPQKVIEAVEDLFPNLEIRVDTRNLKEGQKISGFMKEIKESHNLIIILNDKYYKSIYCMDEIMGFIDHSKKNNHEINNKIYIIVDKGAEDLYSSPDFQSRYSFWTEKLMTNARKIHEDHASTEALVHLSNVVRIVKDILPFFEKNIKDIKYCRNEDLFISNFLPLLKQINDRINDNGYTSFYSDSESLSNAISGLKNQLVKVVIETEDINPATKHPSHLVM